jgi:hypothetical protein
MEYLGELVHARAKVFQDIARLIKAIRRLAETQPTSVESGILLLRQLRSETYEDVNQIQHEDMILKAAEWLISRAVVPAGAKWFWNPRQTGTAAEPDLQGKFNGSTIVSAEITASENPLGVIDMRMRKTLEKLAQMDGLKFYFVRSATMQTRARTKVLKRQAAIEVVLLPFE